ncbi:MAG: AAA family ATPase [Lachnospiraceae bacterium]|nr:AAA family ATPase [Lachnospiraceae bacterium]
MAEQSDYIIIYEARGKKAEWKQVKSALKEAGITGIKSDAWDEDPTMSIYPLDPRDFGEKGRIDRKVYTVWVKKEDADLASEIVLRICPEYTPYDRKNTVTKSDKPPVEDKTDFLNFLKEKKAYVIFAAVLLIVVLSATIYFRNPYVTDETGRTYNYDSQSLSNIHEFDAHATESSYAVFKSALDKGEVERIYVDLNDNSNSASMYYRLKDDETLYRTLNPQTEGFREMILESGIIIYPRADLFNFENPMRIRPKLAVNGWMAFPFIVGGFALLGVFFVSMLRVARRGIPGTETAGEKFEQDEAHPEKRKTFDDIGGLKPLKEDLKVVVDFLKSPDRYHAAGADLPKGLLLVGPPGTGKTLIAQVMADEAGVGFLYANASDFVEKYVGTGAARVRELFRKARKETPCIIFIDEVETLCIKRDGEMNAEDRKSLTALLTEMDGFKKDDNILVIGATNRVEDIDEAALRPGRFTEIYAVPIPETTQERLEVIDIYMKNKKFAEDFDRMNFAREMMGRSPAEIKDVLNEAAIISVQKGLNAINKECVEIAFYKRLMHGHKDHNETDPEELKMIAYHEAGHTLVARLTGNKVTKVTIMPSTSGAGGVTFVAPQEKKLFTKSMMEHKVMELYAGKVAEYLVGDRNWDNTSQGCSNDIEKATEILKNMVDAYGMSDNALVNMRMLSRETSEKSSNYIVRLSEELRDRTVKLMEENFHLLQKLAEELLVKDTLYEDEINVLLELEA